MNLLNSSICAVVQFGTSSKVNATAVIAYRGTGITDTKLTLIQITMDKKVLEYIGVLKQVTFYMHNMFNVAECAHLVAKYNIECDFSHIYNKWLANYNVLYFLSNTPEMWEPCVARAIETYDTTGKRVMNGLPYSIEQERIWNKIFKEHSGEFY